MIDSIKSAIDLKALAGLAVGIFLWQKAKNKFTILA